MALSSSESESKLRQFISLIKWASIVQKRRHDSGDSSRTSAPKTDSPSSSARCDSCTVRGSGLVVGLVGRRCKFDIYTPATDTLNLQVVVRGPRGEVCNEKIVSMFPSLRRMGSSIQHTHTSQDDIRPTMLWKTGTTRLLGASGRKAPMIHRKVPDPSMENMDDNKRIPFDYQCVDEGQFLISYVPRSDGPHSISIKWHNTHIRGSPFLAEVAENIEKLNQQGKGRVKQRKVSFELMKQESLPRQQSASMEIVAEEAEDDDIPCGVTAAVLNRTSKVQRSISRTGAPAAKLAKQATVTRRRVLKRIITKGGQEIVIQEAPPTPLLSRECSSASDDTFELDIGPPQLKRPTENSLQVNTAYGYALKTLDSLNRSRSLKRRHSQLEIHLEDATIEQYMVKLIDNVILDAIEIASAKNNGGHPLLGVREHKPLKSTKSAPYTIARELTASLLLLPNTDNRFVCSPFTDGYEKEPSPFSPLSPELSVDSGNTTPVTTVKEHRKLCAAKSFPFSKITPKEGNSGLSFFGSTQKDTDGTFLFSASNSQTHSDNKQLDGHNVNDANASSTPKEREEVKDEEINQNTTNEKWAKNIINDKQKDKPANITVRTQLREGRSRKIVDRASEKRRARHKKKQLSNNSSVDSTSWENKGILKLSVRKTFSDPLDKSDGSKSSENSRQSKTVPTTPVDSTEPKETLNLKHKKKNIEKNQNVELSQHDVLLSMKSTYEQEMQYKMQAFFENGGGSGAFGDGTMQDDSSLNRLRMSTSLPSLFRDWTKFELDPDDDDTLTIEEMENLSMAVQKKRKRATLGSSELSEAFNELQYQDEHDPKKMLHEFKRQYSAPQVKEVHDITITGVSDEHLSPDTLLLGIPSPLTPSPALSPFSTPSSSRYNSRTNSVGRSDAQNLDPLSEERSSDSQLDHADKDSFDNDSLYVKCKVVSDNEVKSHFEHILQDTLKIPEPCIDSPWEPPTMILKTPKATVDRYTQVTSDEIKQETGWKRPTTYVRPRRKIIRSDAEDIQSSTESMTVGPSGTTEPASTNINIRDNTVVPSVQIKPAPSLKVDRLTNSKLELSSSHGGRENQLQPVRQSTAETIDSGIVDDNSVTSPKNSESSVQRKVPLTPKSKVVNGHRAVTRNKYRGKITLDPKLISNSPNSPSITAENEHKLSVNPLKKKAKTVIQVIRCSRNSSSGRRATWCQRSREDSDDTRILRVRSPKISCSRRRVRFSRQVMMYRRSSSRNSSRHSHDDNQKIDSSNKERAASLERKIKSTPKATSMKKISTDGEEKQVEVQDGNQVKSNNTISTNAASAEIPEKGGANSLTSPKAGEVENETTNAIELLKEAVPMEESSDRSQLQHDNLDTFDGYGVSASTRRDLLDEIDSFSRISSASGKDVQQMSEKRKRLGSAPEVLNYPRLSKLSYNSSFELGSHSQTIDGAGCLAAQSLPTEDASSRVAEYLKNTFGTSAPQVFTSPPTDSEADTYDDEHVVAPKFYMNQFSYRGASLELDSVFTSLDCGESPPVVPSQTEAKPGDIMALFNMFDIPENLDQSEDLPVATDVPDPLRCSAMGAGLHNGQVAARNFFEVKAPTEGNGNLTVNIIGPRPRTVTETCVTYTGDDLYEVTYEANQPGIYIINIRWAEYPIPNSPYLCRLSYD